MILILIFVARFHCSITIGSGERASQKVSKFLAVNLTTDPVARNGCGDKKKTVCTQQASSPHLHAETHHRRVRCAGHTSLHLLLCSVPRPRTTVPPSSGRDEIRPLGRAHVMCFSHDLNEIQRIHCSSARTVHSHLRSSVAWRSSRDVRSSLPVAGGSDDAASVPSPLLRTTTATRKLWRWPCSAKQGQ